MGCQIGGAVTASLTPYIASRMGWVAAFVFAATLAFLGGAMWLLVDPGRGRVAVDQSLATDSTASGAILPGR